MFEAGCHVLAVSTSGSVTESSRCDGNTSQTCCRAVTPDTILFTRPFADKPKRQRRGGTFVFQLHARQLFRRHAHTKKTLFNICCLHAGGLQGVTLQQVPEAHEKIKKSAYTQTLTLPAVAAAAAAAAHSRRLLTTRAHTLARRSVIPAPSFCSSRFN